MRLMREGNPDPASARGIAKPCVLAVRAVIRDGAGRWLLLRRSGQSRHFKGTWEFPGGKADPGETLDASLSREETGLVVRSSGVAGVTECEMEKVHVVILYFNTVGEAGPVTLSAEHDACTWVTPAELRALELNPQIKDFFSNHHIDQQTWRTLWQKGL